MTSQKPKKFISILVVLTMILTLLPATLGLAAYTTLDEFVTNVYEAVYERIPDEEGYNWWVEQLSTKQQTACQFIGYVLLDAPEFEEKFADITEEEFVEKLYNVLFNREGDAEGLEYWIEQLEEGYSRKYVIYAMMQDITNAEFLTFCNTVGIAVGTLDMTEDDYPAPELEVEEVSAINLKQILVEFNSASLINKEAAEDEENYKFEGILPDEDDEDEIDILSADLEGNTVVLTLEDAVENQTEGTLTIKEKILGEKYEEDIEFFDREIPTVVGAEVIGCDTIKVIFSEPINFGKLDNNGYASSEIEDAFELDGGDFFVRSVEPIKYGTEANVKFYTEFDEDTYTLTVLNKLEDYAGFSIVKRDIEVDVVVDETAPEIVGYKDAKAREITLVFDGDIQPADGAINLDVEKFYHTNTKNTAETAEIINGNEIKLTFEEDYELPNGTAYVYVEEEAIEDLWENQNEDTLWIKVEVDYDNEAPKVEKIEMDGQKAIKVTFDEAVDVDSAEDEDNYKVLKEDGKEVDINDITCDEDDPEELLIELDAEIYGKCTLVVEDVKDVYGNKMAKTEIKFEAEDKTAPKFEKFTATLHDVDDDLYTIIVDFDGNKMAVDGKYSVLDVEKYEINGVNLDDIDDYVKIRAIDGNKKVKIEIEKDNDELTIEANDTLVIARVADAAGNYTKELMSDEITIKASGTIAHDKVHVTDNDKIQITLKGKVVDFKADDFIVHTATKSLDVEGAKINNSGDKSVITITLDDDNKLNDDATLNGQIVYVSTDDPDEVSTKDEYGQKVYLDSVKAADKIVPELAETKVNGKTKDDISYRDTKVYIQYTEDIDPASVTKYTYTVKDITVKDVDVDGSVVTLILDPNDADISKLGIGTDVKQELTIRDMNGNKLASFSSEVEYEKLIDNTKPEAKSLAKTIEVNEAITLEVADLATDADGDTLTLSEAASNNTDIATASITDGKLVITGIAAGTATVTVKVSDGIDTVVATVTVTVEEASTEPQVIAEYKPSAALNNFGRVIVNVENIEGAVAYDVTYALNDGATNTTAKANIGEESDYIYYNSTVTVTVYDANDNVIGSYEVDLVTAE